MFHLSATQWDMNVVAFTEAASISGCRETVEEFLACGIWPLCEKYDFEVETKETPLSKVVVPLPTITPVVGMKESGAAFEMWIVRAANLLVGNYNIAKHKAYIGLCHGRLNHVFELAGLHYQPCPEPISHASRKQKVVAAAQAPAPKKATEKHKRVKGASHSGDQTYAQELALAKPKKQSKKIISQSSGLSVAEKSSSLTIKISGGKTSSTSTDRGGMSRALTRVLDLFDSGSSASDDEAATLVLRQKCPQKSPPSKTSLKPSGAPAVKSISAWSFHFFWNC
jgi:hypothetical protein